MRYDERAPSKDLAPWVLCLWELEGDGSAFTEPIFPDGRIELVVHLGDRPRLRGDAGVQPRAMIVGQMLTATRLECDGRMHAIGVRFTSNGARAWLRLPLRQITSRIEDAHGVCGSAASCVRRAIEQGRGTDERLTAAEHAVRRALRPEDGAARAIAHAVRIVERHAGTVSIDALARACGLGPRQLERRFLDEVGVSPKAFARIVRFQQALRALRAGTPPADVAAACGYADQPHLAREFRRFAGTHAGEVNLGNVAFLQDTPGTATANS